MFITIDKNNNITQFIYGNIEKEEEFIELPEDTFSTYDEMQLGYLKYIDKGEQGFEITIDEEKYAEAQELENNRLLNIRFIPSEYDSISNIVKSLFKENFNNLTHNDIIKDSGLFGQWTPGKYEVDDIVNYAGQTYKCFQAHDNSIYPDINPKNPNTFFTFWTPLHGTTPETARPYVLSPNGAVGIYKVGEYCWYNDSLYKCVQDTVYSPEEYSQGWELV